jgi:hypothetical protein
MESEALLAAQEGDMVEVDRNLSQMSVTELDTLAKACQLLSGQCYLWMRGGGADL